MSQVDNIDKIQFSTSFEVDKIIPGAKYNGTISVGASSFPPTIGKVGTISIDNDFGEGVLPIMIFSTNGDDWLEAGSRDFSASSSLNPRVSATCGVNSTQIVVVAQNFTGSTINFRYKIVFVSED